jgi:uncharacterized protein (UPF0332 family)
MKKTSFLSKLKKERKLELVQTSEEIKESYIRKSESSLLSAKILLENNILEESVSLSYYSMYHMLTALMFKAGIKCENHAGCIILMKELFGLDNSDIMLAKTERIDKQYYTDFKITQEETKRAIRNAEEFNSKLLDFISKLNNKEVFELRKKFEKLVK